LMKKEQETAYKDVVAALQEVNAGRTFRNIGTPEREDLDRAVLLLEELSWKIVSEDVAGFSERVGVVSKELAALGARVRRRYSRLKKTAGCLKKAAAAAGRAAGVAGKVFPG
jgi:hypothetical protein